MALTVRDRPIYTDEWKALLVAVFSVAFGFAGIGLLNVAYHPLGFSGGVLAGALVGFLAHELAHRETARRQGCIAGFVLSQFGLALTLASGVLRSIGVPFAILSPGYVSIYCSGFARDDYVAAAGPAANVALAAAAWIAARLAGHTWAYPFLVGFAAMNAWLAFFNLLPFSPLDGSKIVQRSPLAWLVLIALASVFAFTNP